MKLINKLPHTWTTRRDGNQQVSTSKESSESRQRITAKLPRSKGRVRLPPTPPGSYAPSTLIPKLAPSLRSLTPSMECRAGGAVNPVRHAVLRGPHKTTMKEVAALFLFCSGQSVQFTGKFDSPVQVAVKIIYPPFRRNCNPCNAQSHSHQGSLALMPTFLRFLFLTTVPGGAPSPASFLESLCSRICPWRLAASLKRFGSTFQGSSASGGSSLKAGENFANSPLVRSSASWFKSLRCHLMVKCPLVRLELFCKLQ
jgi:hypothetical protein